MSLQKTSFSQLLASSSNAVVWIVNILAPVVQKVDSAIHQINHYPANNTLNFVNTYPLDSAIHLLNN